MKAIKLISVLSILFTFYYNDLNASVCTAIGNGDWSNPANWSCGNVPSCGDLIIIPSGITVNVDTQVDLDENSSPACSTATYILVFGTLQFVTGFKISLACGSGVDVMAGGSMLPGGGGGSSNWLKICSNTEWQTSNGPVFGFEHFGSPIPLPLEFISFSIDQSQNSLNLEWTVASERDNDFFTLEISSDGIVWNNIDTVKSIGDHSDLYTYKREFENSDISFSSHYFKLSQTDKNGVETILEIKNFHIENDRISLFPNPINNSEKLNLSIPSKDQMSSEILIYNYSGKMVVREIIELEKGLNTYQFGVSVLEKGVYFIMVPLIDGENKIKLIVQ